MDLLIQVNLIQLPSNSKEQPVQLSRFFLLAMNLWKEGELFLLLLENLLEILLLGFLDNRVRLCLDNLISSWRWLLIEKNRVIVGENRIGELLFLL